MLTEMPTIKEMSEIFNSSSSNMRQIEFRAIRALSNVLKIRGLALNDFIERV
jgi:DNA-directed RNA polymerase sigma subunit (sigma70/sigma32)